jgi:monofunctional glycosyltransferase
MKISLKNIWKNKYVLKLRKVFFYFIIITIAWVFALKFIPIYTTPYIIYQWLGTIGTKDKIYKSWVADENISESYKLAVIASEDQLFNEHFGFDVSAIRKALKFNKKHPKKIRGASTITQQVAKNVFLWHGHSWIRKGFEIYFTFLIELIWSKERILEVYLNVAEMGEGIFGVEEASKHYFGISAKKVNKTQAAVVAAILPNPIKYKVKNPSPFILKKQNWILHQMKYIDWDE